MFLKCSKLPQFLFLTFFFSYALSFTSHISIPFLSLSLSIFPLPLQLPPSNKIKFKRKKNQFWQGSCSCDIASHTVNPSVHILLVRVHYKESLVWFEVSGFCYTINAGSSPELLLVILLLPCAVEILKLWVCRTGPIMYSSRSQMGWLSRWVMTLVLGLSGCSRLVSLPGLLCPHHQGELFSIASC